MGSVSLESDFALFRRIVRADYHHLMGVEDLDTDVNIKPLILLQSIEGHAHNGHALFHRIRFTDVDTADVVRALGFDADSIKAERQRLIDDVRDYVDAYFNGDHRDRLVNNEGKPFFGVPILGKIKVNPAKVMKGIYLGGERDTPEVRREVERARGITIGAGKCFTVDTNIMRVMGFNGERLATESNENRIDEFKRRGLIVDRRPDDNRYRYKYIRYWNGPGHSDDAAVVVAGLIWGLDTALGVFIADAIDTIEKYTTIYNDWDSIIADEIGDMIPEISDSRDDLLLLTYLSAVPEGMEESYPDSSLRYFLKKDRKTGMTLLNSHINFIRGKPFISVNTLPNPIGIEEFYDVIRARVLKETEARIPDTATLDSLTSPISSIISKDYLVVNEGENIASIAREMGKRRYDFAIIVDDDGKIKGVVRAKDILHYIDTN